MDRIFKSKAYWALLIFIFFVVLVRVWHVPMDDPKGGRTNWRGDAYSEEFSIHAANYWLDHGYLHTYLRPMHNYTGDRDAAEAYLHYPPFSELFTSAAMFITQSRKPHIARHIPVLLSFLFLLWLTRLLQTSLKDESIVLWMLFLILPTSYFVNFADNLYVHALSEMLKIPFMIGLYYHYKQQNPWYKLAPLAFICLILGQISPTYSVFCAIATIGFSIAYKKSWRKILAEENILLGLGFIGGLAIHLSLNVAYLGSIQAMLIDLQGILSHRGGLPLAERLELPIKAINRMERMYLLPGWSMIVFHCYYLKYFKNEKHFRNLSWVLLAAGLAWYFVMAQHASVHSYISREIGLYVIWVGGIGSWAYLQHLKNHWDNMALKNRVLHGVFSLYVIGMAISQQLIPVLWTHSLRHLWKAF